MEGLALPRPVHSKPRSLIHSAPIQKNTADGRGRRLIKKTILADQPTLPKNLLSPRFRLVRIVALLTLPLFGAIGAFGTAPEAQLLLPRTAIPEPLKIDFVEKVVQPATSFFREERFQRGDTIGGLLVRLGVNSEDSLKLLRAHASTLRALRAGTTVDAELGSDGSLVSLTFFSGKDASTTITRDGDGFKSAETRLSLDTRTVLKFGTIRSSLFAAADAAGLPDGVAIQLAEVFAGDIDFHRDLRKGDHFSVVFEMLYHEGRAVRAGRVLAAEFVNAGKSYRAVWYAGVAGGESGKGGYYTPEGKNLRKAFLRSPLEFSRVTSGFGMRMHPIQQQWRAHRGIDYAAPNGTRVRSVGDGVVEFAGRQGGYGNMVVLRHSGQYSTAYAHLSRIAPGLHRGAHVAQGDTIGLVGQTGWATGPHLHFEFRIAGQARNPLAIALPAALPVAAAELPNFKRLAAPLAAQLDLIATGKLALME
jgi:murein DD-endopeptidase MepM/ murein hydrolase activator NlpD